MTDADIVQLYINRDENAILETDITYGTSLRHGAQRILQDKFDAEEAVSDTYLKTWNTIPPHQPEFLYAYIAKICRFFCFDILDRRHAKKRSVVMVELTAEMEQCIPDKYREYEAEGKEIGCAINRFLQDLSSRDQKLFSLRYFHAYSVELTASKLHMSKENAATRLYRIREKLRNYLEKEGITL